MKEKCIIIVDKLLIPVCFMFTFSTLVKFASFTSFEYLIFNKSSWAYGSIVVFLIITFIITPHLYREILALRLPLEEWLRVHHLR